MPRRLLAMKDVEGCEKLWGAAKQASIHRYPNGETRLVFKDQSSIAQYIGNRSEPGELKHLSTRRKRHQFRDSLSSGERTGNKPKPLEC